MGRDAQTEGDGCQQKGIAERRARDSGERRAYPLARAGRDDQGHDRARSDDENGRDHQKGSEQFPIHEVFDPPVLTDARVRRARQPLTAVLVAFFADTLDRYHALAFRGIEYDHTLRRASDNPDALDPRADELAAVGDQHELIPVLDRE